MTPKALVLLKPAAALAPLAGVVAVGVATAALAYMFVKATQSPPKPLKEKDYFG